MVEMTTAYWWKNPELGPVMAVICHAGQIFRVKIHIPVVLNINAPRNRHDNNHERENRILEYVQVLHIFFLLL
jgi:hypothetical protein